VLDTLPHHDAINRVYAAGIMHACTAGSPPNFVICLGGIFPSL
jgi:hypothetical protein